LLLEQEGGLVVKAARPNLQGFEYAAVKLDLGDFEQVGLGPHVCKLVVAVVASLASLG
jgi:hypothetical protein